MGAPAASWSSPASTSTSGLGASTSSGWIPHDVRDQGPCSRSAGEDVRLRRAKDDVWRTALARRPLGRRELRPLTDWKDGAPGTELNFKFYRQATNKVVGLSDEAAAFLAAFFRTA